MINVSFLSVFLTSNPSSLRDAMKAKGRDTAELHVAMERRLPELLWSGGLEKPFVCSDLSWERSALIRIV